MTGVSTELSVLGDDKSGEANLIYSWTVSAMPSGAAAPVFSVNGYNAAKNTVVTFSQAGTYTFTATMTDPVNLSTTSSVMVLVSQTLSSIQVTPASATVTIGSTQQFSALGVDQFGQTLVSQPSFTWRVTGGGTIDANSGRYTAPAVPAQATVTATSGSSSNAAAVLVTLGLNDAELDILTATAFVDDGELDRPDAMEILRSTGSDDNVVDADELSDLQTILTLASSLNMPGYVQVLAGDVVNGSPANARYQGQTLGNLVAGSPASQLNNLVDKWFLGADHPVTSYTYQNFARSLFVDAPTYTDMKQGAVGDCYFIAALGAIAKSSIAAVQNMFIANDDNTWTVRFYAGSTADYVTVDRFLPASTSGKPVYQGVGGGSYTKLGNELWLALAEKAYAQWNETGKTGRSGAENSYASLTAGWMYTVCDQVLGRTSSTFWGLPDADKQYLIDGLTSNKAVTYSTITNPGDGLRGPHAYVVTGYDSTADTFQLYNPWGHTHPAPLTYAQLRSNGVVLVIADTSGPTSPIAAAGAGQAWWVLNPSVSTPPSLAMSCGVSATAPVNDAMPSAERVDRVFAGSASSMGHLLIAGSDQLPARSADVPARIAAQESWFSGLGEDRGIEETLHHRVFLEDFVDSEGLV